MHIVNIINCLSLSVEFMGAIKCLNKDNNMKVRFCLDKLAFLAGTIDKKNKDIMQPSGVPDIKGLCCYIAYTVDCVTTLAKSECKADGDKIAAYIKKIATVSGFIWLLSILIFLPFSIDY